eukprot:SAG25_NODE_1231_length_3554_cov_14.316932_4_plen_150_part_00
MKWARAPSAAPSQAIAGGLTPAAAEVAPPLRHRLAARRQLRGLSATSASAARQLLRPFVSVPSQERSQPACVAAFVAHPPAFLGVRGWPGAQCEGSWGVWLASAWGAAGQSDERLMLIACRPGVNFAPQAAPSKLSISCPILEEPHGHK